MVPQTIKNLYWLTISPLTLASLYCQKALSRLRRSGSAPLVHLGSGKQYLHGFVNIDANVFLKKDLWLDIRFGLPFLDESVRALYMSQVLEHFSFRTAQKVLRDCHRVLATGGGIRIVVPSLEQSIEAFNRGDSQWFPSWPDNYQSVGGRFNNLMLCRDQHSLMFDFSFLKEVLDSAGFGCVERRAWGVSGLFSLHALREMEPDANRDQRLLIVEAIK